MSFILNALRKSEQERLSNHTATLEDKILLKQESTQKKKPGGLVILIIINLFLLSFLLWYFSQQEEEAKAQLTIKAEKSLTAPEPPKNPLKIKAEKPVQVQPPNLIPPPQMTIAQKIKHLQEKEKESTKQPTSLKTDQSIQVTKVNQDSPKVLKKSTTEQEVTQQKPAFAINNKENDPPYLLEMPYEFSLSVPKIKINVFVYAEQPEGRFIMINMRKYLVGQKIDEGMELQEIRADSIVVKYKGKVFQIRR